MIKSMYQDKMPLEKIAKYVEMSVKDIKNILKLS